MNPTRFFAVLVLCLLAATPAAAQPLGLCGDADDNGSVSVTDGVTILSAAAGLDVECDPAVCDFDVNDAITLTDGVNALRKAAELSIQRNCVPTRAFFDPGVSQLFIAVQPLFESVLDFVPQQGEPVPTSPVPCDNSFDDGVVEYEVDGAETLITFSGCEIDGTLIDGDILDGPGGLELSISFTFFNDDTMDFSGFLFGIDREGFTSFGGTLEVAPGLTFPEVFDFILTLQQLELDPAGNILGGQVLYDLREAELVGFAEIDERFDGSNLATVVVTRDDLSRTTTLWDLITKRFI